MADRESSNLIPPCHVPVPAHPGDDDNRDNCSLRVGHPGPHVGYDHAEWAELGVFPEGRYHVVTENDGWRLYVRLDELTIVEAGVRDG